MSKNPQKILKYESWRTNLKNIAWLGSWMTISEIFGIKLKFFKKSQKLTYFNTGKVVQVIEETKPEVTTRSGNLQEKVFR